MKPRQLKASSFVVAAALAALLAAGCGGGDQSETATLSKHQFLKQANAICKESAEAQAAAFRKGLAEVEKSQANGNKNLEELRRMLAEPTYRAVATMIDEVSALGLPADDEEAAKKVIEEFEAGLEKAEADPATFLTGKAFQKADDEADSYGMNDCGV